MTRIAIVGAGHVGVVYAAGLAELGHDVRVVDVDPGRIATLCRGETWFFEPGLDELLAKGLASGRILFTTSCTAAISSARFVFVCVPTPTTAGGALDDSYLRRAFDSVRGHADRPRPIIVNKSTAPVGTADLAARLLGTDEIEVVSNPEFLSQGRALEDFFHPARIVIGARRRAVGEAVAGVYASLAAPVVHTDPITAELSKLAANAFLATKVSFANAMSLIAASVGADGNGITRVLGLDPRIGAGHLDAGLGYGGSCLPKDLAAVGQLAPHSTSAARFFHEVAAVNDAQRERLTNAIAMRLGDLRGRRIAVLGVTFKANTDDLRGSPAVALIDDLRTAGSDISAYDPAAGRELDVRAPGITVASSALAAVQDADTVIVATAWPEFRALDLAAVSRAMRGNLLVDARGVIDCRAANEAGLDYFSLTSAGIQPHRSHPRTKALGAPRRVVNPGRVAPALGATAVGAD